MYKQIQRPEWASANQHLFVVPLTGAETAAILGTPIADIVVFRIKGLTKKKCRHVQTRV
jgi:hypothetical protein